MKRRIEKWLNKWVNNNDRDVLLVRGARQVGKTYSIKKLGKTFKHYLEINFEEHIDIHSFFDGNLTPAPICEQLSIYFGVPIIPGQTLLFLDEIQACPKALSSLRFFKEQMPDLHVVASGSLLEFALEEIPSQGVGRISSLFMYPLSFFEFLEAINEHSLIEIMKNSSLHKPINNVFHKKLIDIYKTYQLIGGMPRVVKAYAERKSLNECMELLDSLLVVLKDDFSKYNKRAPLGRLVDVYNSIFNQAGNKFMYSRIESNCSTIPLKTSLEMLIKAGLAIKVCHSAAQGLPLSSQAKQTKFKILPSDTGLMQRALGLDLPDFIIANDTDMINKGSLAEVFVGLELIKNSSPVIRPSLNYWHRESRGSSAELDYIIQDKNEILPIEIKAGSTGKMKSMHMFLEERNLNRGVRMSLENFSQYGKIESMPIYCAGLTIT
jgi:predicted AAA+ superfamily ATPase